MRHTKLLPSIAGLLVLIATGASQPVLADRFENRMAGQEGEAGKRHSKKKMSAAAQARADNATYKMAGQDFKMRTKNHGKLTRHDQHKLNRELNNNQGRINNATH